MFSNKVNIGQHDKWNPWVGCYKVSPACKNCFIKYLNKFVYLDLPVPKVSFGNVIITCLDSDFFLEEADNYRGRAWQNIREHSENIFLIITKRVERIKDHLPSDWGEGYPNVILAVTVETQDLIEYRLPIFRDIPAKHKWLSCSPLIEPLNLEKYLKEEWIECVETCGEIGPMDVVRPTYYEWVEDLSNQCKKYNIRFMFMKIGLNFIQNNLRRSEVATCYHSPKADALNLDVAIPIKFDLNNKLFILN